METMEIIRKIEAIVHENEEGAKTGSCKTCHFCETHELDRGTHPYECMVSDRNGFWFSESDLESKAYPYGPCHPAEGWYDDDGKYIQNCLGYRPFVSGLGHAVHWTDAAEQKGFLTTLARASRLAQDYQDDTLAKLLLELEQHKSLMGHPVAGH